MEPFVSEVYVLRDMRTNRFFGGGVASELFTHWVADWYAAKTFPSPEHCRPVLEQMIERRKKYADSKSAVLQETPLYEPGAIMIHKIVVTKTVEEQGLIVQ